MPFCATHGDNPNNCNPFCSARTGVHTPVNMSPESVYAEAVREAELVASAIDAAELTLAGLEETHNAALARVDAAAEVLRRAGRVVPE